MSLRYHRDPFSFPAIIVVHPVVQHFHRGYSDLGGDISDFDLPETTTRNNRLHRGP